jgi:PqqD family protein of HPr-rel-A system
MQTATLRELLMNDNGFAFDRTTGYTYTINGAGMEIIRGLKEGDSDEQLVARLLDAYDVDALTARHDIEVFLGQLQRYGLLALCEEVA